jgi:hypothetical protein
VVTAARVAALLAALAAAGCSGKMFRPLTPRVVEDEGAAVNVDGIYVARFIGGGLDDTSGVTFGLEVSWRAPARVGEARLTSLLLPACASGMRSKNVISARGQPGAEELTVTFPRRAVDKAGVLADGPAALDLLVFPSDRSTAGRCVRIPVRAGGAAPEEWVHHAVLVGGEERVMVFHSGVPGLESPGVVLGLGLGAWSGRWRWMLEGEGGFSGRVDPSTGQSGMGRLFGMWGGSASASTLLLSRGRFGLGAIGGYELLRGEPSGPTPAGVTLAPLTLHGPRAGLRLLYLVDPLAWPGFRSPRDAFVGGLAVYGGTWWDGRELQHPSPFYAVSLEGNIGF